MARVPDVLVKIDDASLREMRALADRIERAAGISRPLLKIGRLELTLVSRDVEAQREAFREACIQKPEPEGGIS